MEETEPVEQITPAAPAAAPEPAPASETVPAPEAAAPTPEAAASAPEPAAAPSAPAVSHDPEALAALAEQASAKRLPAPEEEKATQLVRAAVLAGANEELIPLLAKLGWAASSRGIAAAWPDLKATAKSAFIKALSQDESEGSRRIRLSIARALFKLPDIPTCTKLVLGACKEIRDKKTGAIETRDAQNFASVMIGKGKPWIAQIPLADVKPADAALLVHCAVVAAFSVGGPPVTPLGVLKWAGEAGQLAELDEVALAAITKGIARWSPKWANALRNEVPNPPEAILAALKPAQPEPEPQREPEPSAESAEEPRDVDEEEDDDDDEEDDGLPPELRDDDDEDGDAPRQQRPVYVSKTIPPKEQREQRQPQQQREREPKGPPPKSPQFNASEMLRQLEAHISWLKNELQFAEKKLRARDDDRRQAKQRKPDVPVIEGEPTPEELARLNVQLEARITELQARIDDLAIDAEARATSAGVFSGESLPPDAQLRALLGLKLADHYADFAALEQEDRDLVIPQHYRTVLAEVFAVLKAEGVKLEQQPAAPAEQP